MPVGVPVQISDHIERSSVGGDTVAEESPTAPVFVIVMVGCEVRNPPPIVQVIVWPLTDRPVIAFPDAEVYAAPR